MAGPATPRVSSGTITKLGSMYIEAIPAAVVVGVTIVMGDPIVAVAMAGEPQIPTFLSLLSFPKNPSTVRMSSLRPVCQAGPLVETC